MNTILHHTSPEAQIHDDGFINKRQLAQKLKTSPRTIEKWVQQGLIPCMKIGRTVRFNWEMVKKELQANCGR